MNDKIRINKRQTFEIYHENVLEKLENKILGMKKNNENKLFAYQNKINSKIEKNEKNYQTKLILIDKWELKKKNKAKAYFQNKLCRVSKKIQKDLTLNTNNCVAKYNANKNSIYGIYQRDKAVIKNRVEQDSINAKTKYHSKFNYYQLEFKNFMENLNKNVSDYEQSKRIKIAYQFDKGFYFNEYNKLNLAIEKKIWNEKNFYKKKELIEAKKTLPFQIFYDHNLAYTPFSVNFNKKKSETKDNIFSRLEVARSNIHNLRYWNWRNIFKIRLFEIPWYLYAISLLIVGVAVYTNNLSAETMEAMAVLFAIAIIAGEIFNRLPLWRTYIGGGTMGVFFLAAILGTFKVIPVNTITNIKLWFDKGGFLNLYINVLIVGSILTIPRKLILQSFTGFIGLLIAGVSLAVLVGYGFSQLIGLPLDHTVLKIMLPLLSDGNGGGVQPLSAMSSSYHYMSYKNYMSFALAVSSISNVFVIIIAALLTTFLSKSPTLSGNGRMVKKEILTVKENVIANDRNVAGGLFIACIIYVLTKMFEISLEKATGIAINAFAWTVIISLLINLFNILPKTLKAGCDTLNKFFTKQFTWFLMAGVGLTMTDLKIFGSLFTNWKDIFIILIMDISLIIGPFLISNFIKFYTLESMIAAGCCMGAQGGAGSLAVLGAAKRMELLPYSQITCRIGGGIVLIVAAPLFLAFTKVTNFAFSTF